jgi:hypothetical protein
MEFEGHRRKLQYLINFSMYFYFNFCSTLNSTLNSAAKLKQDCLAMWSFAFVGVLNTVVLT